MQTRFLARNYYLEYKTYTVPLRMHQQKTNGPVRKWVKNRKRQFAQEDMQMAKRGTGRP